MAAEPDAARREWDWVDLRLRPLVSLAVVGVGVVALSAWELGPWIWVLDGLLVVTTALLWLYAYKGRNTTRIDPVRGSVRVTYRALGVTFYRREFPRAEIDCVRLGWDDEAPAVNEAASGAGVHPVTLRLASGRKWLVLQSAEEGAAGDLARRLGDEIGVPRCGEE